VTDDERERAWAALHDAIAKMPGWAVGPCTYHGEVALWHVAAIDLGLADGRRPGSRSHGEVIRIDRDVETRSWLTGRFEAMTQDIVTTWDIAQDIAANWTEGRCVSELPECRDEKNNRLKYPGQVFREWLVTAGGDQTGLDRPNVNTTTSMLKAARIKQIAPPEYDDLPWSLYAELPAAADAERVADIFSKAAAQPVCKDGINGEDKRPTQNSWSRP